MAYNINKSNGQQLVVVEEGTADLTTTSLTLIGKNFSGYGESLNENLVHLLENFSHTVSPSSPIKGQLWYDNNTKILKIYDGKNFVASGAGVELDNSSTAIHYNVFVSDIEGAPPFKVGGVRGMTMTPATGNHAIGRSTPASAKFEINNSNTATKIFNAYPQFDQFGQEVGIHVHGDDYINGRSTRIVVDSYGYRANYDGIGIASTINLRRARGNSTNSAALRENDAIGSLAAHGHDGIGFSPYQGYLVFRADQDWSNSTRPTRLELWLTPRDSLVNKKVLSVYGNGDVKAEGDVIAFTSSDENLKQNIRPIDGALEKIKHLQGVVFNWNDLAVGKDTDKEQVGLLAQQVLKACPQAVIRRENGFLAVDYEKLVPLLIQSIKELGDQVDRLRMAQ